MRTKLFCLHVCCNKSLRRKNSKKFGTFFIAQFCACSANIVMVVWHLRCYLLRHIFNRKFLPLAKKVTSNYLWILTQLFENFNWVFECFLVIFDKTFDHVAILMYLVLWIYDAIKTNISIMKYKIPHVGQMEMIVV